MSEDIDRFVRDPGLLIELCRDVINRIDREPTLSNTSEKEAQLREIAKAVEKLEKMGVSVPDSLRAEKTKLVTEIAYQTQGKQALRYLAVELAALIKDLNNRMENGGDRSPNRKGGKKRSHSLKTDRKILRKYIIEALKTLGCRASVADVMKEMEKQLKGKLHPGDLEWRESTNDYVWQNNAKWERYHMTQDGTLRSDSPRGYWELGREIK